MIATQAKTLRLAVLISGGGRSLENLMTKIREARLPATVELVIASNLDAPGLKKAADAGLRTRAIVRKGTTVEDFSRQITEALDEVKPDLVCLMGFLSLYQLPDHYLNRMMNIHPALLPAFGGKGMYGRRVHEAVLKTGCKISGCTVHFADNEYDQGPIIIQRAVPVLEDDTPDTLAARVFEEEKIAYPEAITLFAQDRLRIIDRRVRILPENS